MYSCINQPRGCRGRVNTSGGRCESCRQLNLKKQSPFDTRNRNMAFQRPSIDFNTFRSLPGLPTLDERPHQ
ncbi:hypothetical protein BJ508DRAFT_325915 [Ascobolus immersus RN42]|uniref:Uncharacterized protein n=1 Tax=Ascobolus immersus RN42 TaxID=1160509 RepID=A0A3N4I737_ASCIM|nr:hypothetical protein BJ508DRAFT_325915 [Ascobolus immersus RN42]